MQDGDGTMGNAKVVRRNEFGALVGKVWKGIEHLSSLPRGTGPLGFFEAPSQYVPIKSVRFLKEDEALKVMRTDTPEFNRFVELRTTRNEDWFIEPTGKIELCNVWVPVKAKN